MGKATEKRPFVSVCTPTFNRRPFIQSMFQCFRNQTYPKDRMEWIIVDDGTDKIKDLVDAANIPQIKYFSVDKKMKLGSKRNFMHQKTKGDILVYMDDDDYYPPERVEHAVSRLLEKPEALCAGSSEIYVFFKHIQKMYQGGPYSPNHATAGTFAFRKELLLTTRYEDEAALAEEKAFLKDYTVPFVQLDPLKTILVFSHTQNTFDKRKLLDEQHTSFFKESPKTVDMFIKFKHEESIKKFFLQDIDSALANYSPGDPSLKPDVLKQMKEIELERQKMIQEANEKQNMNGQVMIQQPGMPPRPLALHELVEIIQQQQNEINKRGERISQTERLITEMHSKISKLLTENKEYEKKLKEMAKSNPPLDKTMRSDAFTSISESEQVELTMKKNPFLSKVIPEVMVNIT
jgi:glycosyltransferase involved in cell wall biosynthesis